MKIKLYFIFFLFVMSFCTQAQMLEYAVAKIADSLKENSNYVLRLDERYIDIKSQENMIITTRQTVTVFNEVGMKNLHFSEY